MGSKPSLNTEKAKAYQKFYGNYRGIVIDNDDPLKNGAIRVKVMGVYDFVHNDHLPWAIFADPFMGGLGGNGSSFIPEVGSHVWVFFEAGDHMSPVYFAGAPAIENNVPDLPEESRTKGKYPFNKVIKTRNGLTFEFDDTDGDMEIRMTHPSGINMTWDNSGNIKEIVAGDTVIDNDGNVKWTAPNMQFGEDGSVEPSVLGDKLATWIANELTLWLNGHQHIGNLGAPTGTPIVEFEPGTGASGGAVYSTKNKNQ